MAATNWSERIPAAIARGKEHLPEPNPGCLWPNEGEVALAEALVELWEQARLKYEFEHMGSNFVFKPHPALITFTEKIERLSHD